jgi:hypothetical protein
MLVKEVGLKGNTKKTKYIFLSCHQNAGQNHNITIANRSLENVVQFKFLGTTVTNQILIHDKIKSKLNSGNACYHSVQNLSFSCLLSKNINIKTHNTMISPVILYGYETLSLTLREEHRVRAFENRVLRILGPNRDEMVGGWRKLHYVFLIKYN